MKESIRQLRLKQSREFNTFCDKILAHDGSYSKPVSRQLTDYQQLFTAILGNEEFREMASNNLQRLLVVELLIKQRNAAQS
jgi:hypothetical protein